MGTLNDLTGKTFGRWIVVQRSTRPRRWVCRCTCGQEKEVAGYTLTNGKSTSCGCLRKEVAKKTHIKHGKRYTPEYRVWLGMHERCNNPEHVRYHRYGGRGVTVCRRWKSFENFLADMGERPSKEHSIERKDGGRGYTPKNCYWATTKEQANNREGNVVLTFEGKTMTLTQWAEELNIKYGTLYYRVVLAEWPLEKAFS